MMDLWRIQLRAERTAILAWGLGLFVLNLSVAASYTAIEDSGLDEALSGFEGLEDAFGVDSLTSVDGYLKSNSIALFPLLLGIYAGLAAAKALAGAQESGRLDHILARPVSRIRYLLVVSGALALTQLLILVAAGIGATWGYAIANRPAEDIWGAFAMTIEVLPIALAHLSLGVLIGSVANRRGQATMGVLALVVGTYALDLIGKLVEDLDWLEFVTMYGWWSRSNWFDGNVDAGYLVVSFCVVVAAMAGAVLRFNEKDL